MLYDLVRSPEAAGPALRGVSFRFMPDMRDVASARALYTAAGKPIEHFTGVPVFQAAGLSMRSDSEARSAPSPLPFSLLRPAFSLSSPLVSCLVLRRPGCARALLATAASSAVRAASPQARRGSAAIRPRVHDATCRRDAPQKYTPIFFSKADLDVALGSASMTPEQLAAAGNDKGEAEKQAALVTEAQRAVRCPTNSVLHA